MKTTELAKSVGVTASQVRKALRKLYGKANGTWEITEEQVATIIAELKKASATTAPAKSVTGLTENEVLVLDFLINKGWYAEQGYSDQTVSDIAAGINKPIASVKGYCGSLVKKGYIWISEQDGEVPPLVYAKETNPEYSEAESDAKLFYNKKTGKFEY